MRIYPQYLQNVDNIHKMRIISTECGDIRNVDNIHDQKKSLIYFITLSGTFTFCMHQFVLLLKRFFFISGIHWHWIGIGGCRYINIGVLGDNKALTYLFFSCSLCDQSIDT